MKYKRDSIFKMPDFWLVIVGTLLYVAKDFFKEQAICFAFALAGLALIRGIIALQNRVKLHVEFAESDWEPYGNKGEWSLKVPKSRHKKGARVTCDIQEQTRAADRWTEVIGGDKYVDADGALVVVVSVKFSGRLNIR